LAELEAAGDEVLAGRQGELVSFDEDDVSLGREQPHFMGKLALGAFVEFELAAEGGGVDGPVGRVAEKGEKGFAEFHGKEVVALKIYASRGRPGPSQEFALECGGRRCLLEGDENRSRRE
jgi:hypothetical protein